MRYVLQFFLAVAAASTMGCGAHGKSVAVAAPGGLSDPAALSTSAAQWSSDAALRQKVSLTIPKGWRETSQDMLRNDALRETVTLVVGESHRTVTQEMMILCERQQGFAFLCGDATLTLDGRVGVFRIKRADIVGEVVVVHFGQDGRRALFFVGLWPEDREKTAQAEFERLVDGTVVDDN